MADRFGLYIRKERLRVGKTLAEVAKHLDMTHVYLSKVERGKAPPLQQVHFDALLGVLPGLERETLEELADFERMLRPGLREATAQRQQELGLVLARKLFAGEIPEERALEMLEMLRKEDGNE